MRVLQQIGLADLSGDYEQGEREEDAVYCQK